MANLDRALEIVKEQLGEYSECTVNEERFAANLKAFLQSQFAQNNEQRPGQLNNLDDEVPIYSGNDTVERFETDDGEILGVESGNDIIWQNLVSCRDRLFIIFESDSDSDGEQSDSDLEYESDEEGNVNKAVYPYETRKKIVDFWLNNSKKGKVPFKRIKHLWNRVENETSLYTWKKRIDEGLFLRIHIIIIEYFINSNKIFIL